MKRAMRLSRVMSVLLMAVAVVSACTDNGTENSSVAVENVELNKMILSVAKGETETLKATILPADATNKGVVWSSSDPSVATVHKGVVVGIKYGETVITATTSDGSKTASCMLTVTSFFPDANFRNILIRVYNLKETDGNIDPTFPENAEKIKEITKLYLPEKEIKSLSGIKYFENLTELVCPDNQLTNLDLSANQKLTKLDCYGNQLTKLDLSANTELISLYCHANQFTNLDLSANTKLMWLYCTRNQLTNLDLSANQELKELFCFENQLTNLDLSANTKLIKLYCSENQFTNINLSANNELIELYCAGNQLTNLNLSTNQELMWLDCARNSLTNLELSANKKLNWLDCSENSLTNLNLFANTELIRIYCHDNQFTDLDLSANTKLMSLHCSNNKFANLNLSANQELIWLYCYGNQLSKLDISHLKIYLDVRCGLQVDSNEMIQPLTLTLTQAQQHHWYVHVANDPENTNVRHNVLPN